MTDLEAHLLDEEHDRNRKKGEECGVFVDRKPVENHYLNKSLDELGGKFEIEKDKFGFPNAISKGGFVVLHLNPGTVRNEEYLQPIVDLLNGGRE